MQRGNTYHHTRNKNHTRNMDCHFPLLVPTLFEYGNRRKPRRQCLCTYNPSLSTAIVMVQSCEHFAKTKTADWVQYNLSCEAISKHVRRFLELIAEIALSPLSNQTWSIRIWKIPRYIRSCRCIVGNKVACGDRMVWYYGPEQLAQGKDYCPSECRAREGEVGGLHPYLLGSATENPYRLP